MFGAGKCVQVADVGGGVRERAARRNGRTWLDGLDGRVVERLQHGVQLRFVSLLHPPEQVLINPWCWTPRCLVINQALTERAIRRMIQTVV